MKHTKKMVLVPFDQIQQRGDNKPQGQQYGEGVVQQSDTSADKSVSPVMGEPVTGENMTKEKLDQELILIPIPQKYRRRARDILQKINSNTTIDWDDRGQLIIQGDTVEGSHMTDILKYFLYKNADIAPMGYNRVVSLLDHFKRADIRERHRSRGPYPTWRWIQL